MFVPGDPIEQRKRKLIAKLAGRRGQGGGGFKVGRPAGAGFGRGIGFGAGGAAGQRGLALPQLLGGYGGGGGNAEYGQGAVDTSTHQNQYSGLGSSPGDPNPYFNDVVSPSNFPQMQPQVLSPQVLQQLLGSYGSQGGYAGGRGFFAS